MGQAEERIKDYMDNLDQHYAEHCKDENLQDDKSNLLDAQVIICPDCLGTGKEICDSPDHGFRDAVGGVRLDGHANGCPCCGNDELHRIPNTTCNKCNGTGKL